jgi:sigma-E factor negative regulatory protein RseA
LKTSRANAGDGRFEVNVMNEMRTQEMVSALADGELQGDAFARAVEVAAGNDEARDAWHTYHLIGDVLRSGEMAAGPVPDRFLARLQARLREEQSPPAFAVPAQSMQLAVAASRSTQHAAANEGNFRWKLLAGVASLTAIGTVAWSLSGTPAGAGSGQLAREEAPAVLANTQRGVMIRDARLDELLAAHRQMGGASVLPAPAGALRNAAFEGPAR